MNWVPPIRDENTLLKFKEKLRERDIRYFILFEIGVGTGMQLRDILKLRVQDVRGKDCIAAQIGAKEVRREFFVPPELKQFILEYTEGKALEDLLFPGSSGASLSREQVYKVFKEAGKSIGLNSVGAQTMRKTFAWRYYKETGDIYYLQDLLNHSAPSITYRYIGEKPAVELRLNKLTPEENERSRRSLYQDGNGRMRIEALKATLEALERQLDDPTTDDAFYGRLDCLLSGMEELAEAFRESGGAGP